ncbi:MAG: cytidine deaminase [Xanthomonadales bacterium]|nr:cytidine deaminase [Xanthomonadales bacterium]
MSKTDQDRLLQSARLASAGAYSPYSKFRVGSAVLDAAGNIHAGCNVENASYGLTSCAERNALAAAMAAGQHELSAILIYVPGKRLFEPCGACRQVMFELMPGTAPVWSVSDIDRRCWTVADLLPEPFEPRLDPTLTGVS